MPMKLKTLIFYLRDTLIIGCTVLLLLELSLRAYFYITIGRELLFYGTPYCCGPGVNVEKRVRNQVDLRKQANIDDHSNVQTGYFKYFPHQKRRDFDENNELFDVTINNYGFRGRDFQIEKPRDILRVVTLGASSTFGHYDRDHETYPFYLEQKLKIALAASGDRCGLRDVEVINLGIPHLVSDNILHLFREEGLALKPDVVTFYEGINDASANSSSLAWENRPAYYRATYKLKKWLISFALLHEFIRSTNAEFDRAEVQAYIGDRPSRFIGNVREIRDLSTSQGAVFLAITQQAQSSRYPDEARKGVTYRQEVDEFMNDLEAGKTIGRLALFLVTHSKIMDALREWSVRESVPLVDGIALLDRRRDLLASWVHLKAQGNEILSAALAEKILQLRCGADRGAS